jgi:hypothetical protein
LILLFENRFTTKSQQRNPDKLWGIFDDHPLSRESLSSILFDFGSEVEILVQNVVSLNG